MTDQHQAYIQVGSQVYLASELLTFLRKGSSLKKHGRLGAPKYRHFKLSADDRELQWKHSKNQTKSIKLCDVVKIVKGQHTKVFVRDPAPNFEHLSFSLIYNIGGKERSLDLVCKNQPEYETWFQGLKFVTSLLRPPNVGTPVIGGDSPKTVHAKLNAMKNSRGHVPGRVTGVLGFPTRREIGDAYIWGQLPTPIQAEGGRDGDMLKSWKAGPSPVIVQATRKLDIQRVACASHHACVVTRTGELYTWGCGDAGSLGHGSLQHSPYPQQVLGVYRANSKGVLAIGCNENITVAATEDGLFTWGTGTAGQLGHGANTMRVCLPTLVTSLQDVRIEQVSCGPFHMAALSSTGHLYTWGDGLCGKLGHGDSKTRLEPVMVEALVDYDVLQVSCGWWHTAALGRPRDKDNTTPVHLLTWGGDCKWKELKENKGGRVVKQDHHQGCLGLGDLKGRLLPTLVEFQGKPRMSVKQVACGLNLTVVLNTNGEVFQMGTTVSPGASSSQEAKWEGASAPEPIPLFALKELDKVRAAPNDPNMQDPRFSLFGEEISCGTKHVVVVGSLVTVQGVVQEDKKRTRLVAWGRGSEGQLGIGLMEGEKMPTHHSHPQHCTYFERRRILHISCGSSHSLVVAEHDPSAAEQMELAELEGMRRAGRRGIGPGGLPASPSALSLVPASTSRVADMKRVHTVESNLSLVSTSSSTHQPQNKLRKSASMISGLLGRRRASMSSTNSSQSTQSSAASPMAVAWNTNSHASLHDAMSNSSFTHTQSSMASESPMHRTMSASHTPRSELQAPPQPHEGLLRMQRMQEQVREAEGHNLMLRIRSQSEPQVLMSSNREGVFGKPARLVDSDVSMDGRTDINSGPSSPSSFAFPSDPRSNPTSSDGSEAWSDSAHASPFMAAANLPAPTRPHRRTLSSIPEPLGSEPSEAGTPSYNHTPLSSPIISPASTSNTPLPSLPDSGATSPTSHPLPIPTSNPSSRPSSSGAGTSATNSANPTPGTTTPANSDGPIKAPHPALGSRSASPSRANSLREQNLVLQQQLDDINRKLKHLEAPPPARNAPAAVTPTAAAAAARPHSSTNGPPKRSTSDPSSISTTPTSSSTATGGTPRTRPERTAPTTTSAPVTEPKRTRSDPQTTAAPTRATPSSRTSSLRASHTSSQSPMRTGVTTKSTISTTAAATKPSTSATLSSRTTPSIRTKPTPSAPTTASTTPTAPTPATNPSPHGTTSTHSSDNLTPTPTASAAAATPTLGSASAMRRAAGTSARPGAAGGGHRASGSGGSDPMPSSKTVDPRPLDEVEIGERTVREAERGVFLILERVPGGFELKRIRFARRQFTHIEAESWWPDNRERITAMYNLVSSSSRSGKQQGGGGSDAGSGSGNGRI